MTLQLSSDNTAAAELRVMTCALRALGVLNSVGGWNRRRRGRPRPAESAAMMAWSRGVVVAGGAAAHRVVAGQIGIVVGWLLLYLRIPSVDRLLLHRQRPSAVKPTLPVAKSTIEPIGGCRWDLQNPCSTRSASIEVSGLAPCSYLHITPDLVDRLFSVRCSTQVQCC